MIAKPGIYFVDSRAQLNLLCRSARSASIAAIPTTMPLQVMNSILGGGSTARLFMNLREDKGYTYGAYSRFAFRRGSGPFSASAEVQTAVTKELIVQFMKELNGIRGGIPISAANSKTISRALSEDIRAGLKPLGRSRANYLILSFTGCRIHTSTNSSRR